MDGLRTRLGFPALPIAAGIAIGLILGLIWGYLVAPVEWSDAAPVHLRSDLQEDYLRMTIESFSQSGDLETAQRRWVELGSAGPETLLDLESKPGELTIVEIEMFRSQVVEPLAIAEEGGEQAAGGVPAWIWFLCVGALLVAGLVVTFLIRRRSPVEPAGTQPPDAGETRMTGPDEPPQAEESPPITQFMTTYMLGDDLFDDSFSIDSASGEFLGECGVGIAETAGEGEPKRVNALEVWLFDKNDIQTVTKVVMSEQAYHDATTHDRLSAKGDPVLAQVDNPILLETAKLRLSARIVDLIYGDDPMLPENSYFNQATVELAIWPR